jgi:hypothetical protein
MQRVHNVLGDTAHAGEIGPLHLLGDFQQERQTVMDNNNCIPDNGCCIIWALLSGSSMSQVAQEGQQDMLRPEQE